MSTDIWETTRLHLKRLMPGQKWRLWIDPMVFVAHDAGVVVLACPNEYFKRRVADRYSGILTEELSKAAGRPVECRLRAEPPGPKHGESARPLPTEPQRPLPGGEPRPMPVQPLSHGQTFDSFVIGDANEFAFRASVQMAARKSESRQVLYLLSKTGLGKTHLTHAIGHHILTTFPGQRVFCVTADDFTDEMVRAFRTDTLSEFKEKYRRRCDVLLIEDIQHLTGKERTQLELALTLDSLLNTGKKLIFSSCYMPGDIPKLNNELRSRLACGLITSIDNPDYKTRVRILEKKAAGIDIPMDVLRFLAADLTEDVRQLEGGLRGVAARAELCGRPADMAMAEAVVDSMRTRKEAITLSVIKKLVCKHYKISEGEIESKSRKHNIVKPRQIAIYLCRRFTDLPLAEIGQGFNRYHATALHAIAAIDREMKADRSLKRQVDYLCEKLEG